MDRFNLNSGKSVLLCDPYYPNRSMLSTFTGRDKELRAIFASWIATDNYPPLCPLMIGEPGVGKNRIVYELHNITGLNLYILQGHEDITAEDLACAVRFSDGEHGKMDYVLSPLVTAMYKGGICFIDEIGKIRPRALSLLVSVLDERRYIDSTLLGERIEAAKDFRFVAATNSGEENDLPEFIRSRMKPVVKIDHPDRKDIEKIIETQSGVRVHRDELLTAFWDLWRNQDLPPTPRDVIQLFALAATLCCYRNTSGENFLRYDPTHQYTEQRKRIREKCSHPSIEVQDLNNAFKELYE